MSCINRTHERMSGSTTEVFVMPGLAQQLLAGGAGGGDDPGYPCPWSFKSAHELDDVVPRRRNPAAAGSYGDFQCPICERVFGTQKAVYGHMRCHHDRPWRGMEPPKSPPRGEVAADGKRYRYVCDRCRAPFETRQALGGHRASHSSKKGCFWYSKQELAEAAAAAQRPFMLDFDLNDPAPEAAEDEE